MAIQVWLSIAEISRLWGEETGLDASAFKKDLEEWFADRGKVLLAAGLAIPLVTLLFWGADTMIQSTSNEQIPPTAETADTMAGPGSADGGQPPAQAETAALSLEPATGKLDLGGAVPQADEQALAAAQHQIARLTAAVEASDSMVARLRDELAVTRQAVETARQTTSAEANAETDAKRQDLTLAATVSSVRLATLQRELESAHQQIAELSHARDAASADTSGLRASLQQAEDQAEDIRQDLTLAVTASSARVATLQKELRAAQQQIADLSKAAEAAEDEAVRLREELAARQQEAAATQPPTAPSDQNPVADQKDPDQTQEAEGVEAAPEFEEILIAAEMSSNPVTSETAAPRDTVSPDDLLLEPGHHAGREVVVTGSVVWLLRRYWLQSDSGHMSMLIDVEGLQLDDRNKLEHAVVQIEFLAQARARITGTIERQGSENYRLAATELVLVK